MWILILGGCIYHQTAGAHEIISARTPRATAPLILSTGQYFSRLFSISFTFLEITTRRFAKRVYFCLSVAGNEENSHAWRLCQMTGATR
jgi:hypothetical protein